jgi:predicted acylesterase/phospholipase RssA
MKYVAIGPAAMGIFAYIGFLKRIEPHLTEVEEFSGASAGAILATLLTLGKSVDEIFNTALDLDIDDFMQVNISSFLNNYGFVEMAPVRKRLKKICGCDPTFAELDKTLHISAFCLNTGRTEYFNKMNSPHMKVLDAVCMSMAIPLIFSSCTHNGHTYVDGGTHETLPVEPFLGKKPHEVVCIKLGDSEHYIEEIDSHVSFVESLLRASLSNRQEHVTENMHLIKVDVGDINVFDFSMLHDTKLKLYCLGYDTPCFFCNDKSIR